MKTEKKMYDELDMNITIKCKDGKEISESDFINFGNEIEIEMSNDKFQVIVSQSDEKELEMVE